MIFRQKPDWFIETMSKNFLHPKCNLGELKKDIKEIERKFRLIGKFHKNRKVCPVKNRYELFLVKYNYIDINIFLEKLWNINLHIKHITQR